MAAIAGGAMGGFVFGVGSSLCAIALLGTVACNSKHHTETPDLGVDDSGLLQIQGGSLKTGFAQGMLRDDRTLASFKVSKYPVTWAQFNACVAVGKCKPADGSECVSAGYSAYPGYS